MINKVSAALKAGDVIAVRAVLDATQLTDDTGVFWFFAPSNLELMVKVLDGSGVNGHFWVFYGALSDVEYTITVTDTATGSQRTYHNPLHHLASGAYLDAFPAGPATR